MLKKDRPGIIPVLLVDSWSAPIYYFKRQKMLNLLALIGMPDVMKSREARKRCSSLLGENSYPLRTSVDLCSLIEYMLIYETMRGV